ncbi:WGxxGxxG family protein [Paenibacillus agri]|uniref:WGxxGxxG-CTERM domain-containing protein n=1 Tax=Paenibacillus agri TaxID=2744309 RepID=A0A850EX93_9BACL|nr:WGxxGxxG family protein [Paenibacillus agri]NUU62471.1 WGxxGxxG-CTERM domain-containing protein [Paenibacillus agri]
MNKLITSLICTAALSITLLGTGYTAEAAGVDGVGDTTRNTGTIRNDANRLHPNGSMINGTTGTGRSNSNILDNNVRTEDNHRVAPLSTTNQNGTYRATSTTSTGNGSNWGWLGLIGLLGLAGMRNRTGERN